MKYKCGEMVERRIEMKDGRWKRMRMVKGCIQCQINVHTLALAQVSVGMGMVDLEYIGDCFRAMEAGKRLSPYFVPRILPNLAAGHIAIEHGLRS